MKFRKKPVYIDAIRFDGANQSEIREFTKGKMFLVKNDKNLYIESSERTLICNIGDWIIKGMNGEFYLCEPGIFSQTYDEVSE